VPPSYGVVQAACQQALKVRSSTAACFANWSRPFPAIVASEALARGTTAAKEIARKIAKNTIEEIT